MQAATEANAEIMSRPREAMTRAATMIIPTDPSPENVYEPSKVWPPSFGLLFRKANQKSQYEQLSSAIRYRLVRLSLENPSQIHHLIQEYNKGVVGNF